MIKLSKTYFKNPSDAEKPSSDDGNEKDEKKKRKVKPPGSNMPAIAATAAGLGAGALAWHSMRKQELSGNPHLRKLQVQADRHGFHRVVTVKGKEKGDRLSLLDKIKHFVNEGHSNFIGATEQGDLIGGRRNIGRGVVWGRVPGVSGGSDVEGSSKVQRAVTRLGIVGKERENEMLGKFAPGAMPTHRNVSEQFRSASKRVKAASSSPLNRLRDQIKSQVGGRFFLKPSHGLHSGGEFPGSSHNWDREHAHYVNHMSNPENRREFNEARRGGENDLSDYLRVNGLYEGHVINSALKKPRSAFAQRIIPNLVKEHRIHTIQGAAPAHLAFNRKAGLAGDTRSQRSFVERVLSKLPEKYRKGNYSMDIGTSVSPSGRVKHHVLEMNPTERVTRTSAGGGSGLLDSSVVPGVGHLSYKSITGRHTPLASGLAAAGAATAIGGSSYYLMKKYLNKGKKKKKVDEKDSNKKSTPSV